MSKSKWSKFVLIFWLLVLGLFLMVLPALADGEVTISSAGAGSPEIKANGTFVAVVYFKQDSEASTVYLKSATQSDGWLTSSVVGFGSGPQLAFSAINANIVFVVWANSTKTAIESAQCTLDTTLPYMDPATCVPGAPLEQTVTASLDAPDIVVDSAGMIHVVWVNDGVIKTARSSVANSVGGWTGLTSVSGSNNDQKPVLAWSSGNNGQLHLAFLRGSNAAAPNSVQYRRSSDDVTPHTWGNNKSFTIGAEIVQGTPAVHDRVDSPTITALTSDVVLAWGAHRSGDAFSLIAARSTDNGGSWLTPLRYVPSDGNATTTSGGTAEDKYSTETGLPKEKEGLRPSLIISGVSAAIAWQQFPDQDGCNFNPSVIYYTQPITGGSSSTLAADRGKLDPDWAVVGGQTHFVYMKDVTTNLCGSGVNGYRITYQGPFINQDNDRGEGGGTFLPIIQKN
ncbi:MAG: hypothetical protein U0401_02815 [Anaerolineae bacterium]